MRLRLLTAAALVATTAIVTTSCTSSGSDPAGDAGADPVAGIETPATRPVSLLAASDDCGALLERIQDSVRPHVGPYGLLGYGPHPMAWAARTSGNFVLLGDVAATSAPKQATDLGHSTTNVQEAGIDEADSSRPTAGVSWPWSVHDSSTSTSTGRCAGAAPST